MLVLIGSAARGRPDVYRKEIEAALPPSLADVRWAFDLNDDDGAWGEDIESCDAIVLTSRGLGGRAIERAGRLRFVQKLGIVAERVDTDACKARGILVSVVPDAGHVAVAEHTVAMMLCFTRNLVSSHEAVVGGENPRHLAPLKTTQNVRYPNWLGLPESNFPLLCDLTVGLIGLGEIAREVASRARALGMNVVYTKRSPLPGAVEEKLAVKYLPLPELLSRSDFVSLHTTRPEATKPLIGKREFGLMRSSAVIINTARGNHIDEDALVEALQARRIGGAALDVFAEEPLRREDLRKAPNVLLTPHSAGVNPMGRRFLPALMNLNSLLRCERLKGLI